MFGADPNKPLRSQDPDIIIQIRARADANQLELERNVHFDFVNGINANWENKTCETIKRNKSRAIVAELKQLGAQALDDRRGRLASLLRTEKAEYENEIQSQEHSSAKQNEILKARALALKDKREGVRKKIVEEKLYQQWRQSIDDLRTADVKLSELQTCGALDQQVIDKEERVVFGKMQDEMFNQQSNQQYRERLAREKREAVELKKRNETMQSCLIQQIDLRKAEEAEEAYYQEIENKEASRLHKMHLEEEKTRKARQAAEAREARGKVEEFRAISEAIKAKQAAEEKEQERTLLMIALKKEKEEVEEEEAAKEREKEAANAYMADQNLEKSKDKEISLFLDQCNQEEADEAFKKREEIWDKEAAAKYKLLCEVYTDRWDQIEQKKAQQQQRMKDVKKNRQSMQDEIDRLKAQDDRKNAIQHEMKMEHQEELCKQIDMHQIQHERARQQSMLEARQASITEANFNYHMSVEKAKQATLALTLRDHRAKQQEEDAKLAGIRSMAPWEKEEALAKQALQRQ